MHILTFDLEEWFHLLDIEATRDVSKWTAFESRVESHTDQLLTLLEERGIKSTFFCLGWIGKHYPDLIKKIHRQGHDIATHSDLHGLVYKQSVEEFEKDIKSSLDILEDITGEKVKMFRAPGFSITRETAWALEILNKLGVEIDCSLKPSVSQALFGGSKSDYAKPFLIDVNGIQMKEFPISSVLSDRVLGGGGYFRLLPSSVFSSWMERKEYFMTYFHPRDFDAGQEVLPGLSMMRRFKSYYGLSKSFDKFRKMLLSFEFCSIKEAEKQIDWSGVHRASLKPSDANFDLAVPSAG